MTQKWPLHERTLTGFLSLAEDSRIYKILIEWFVLQFMALERISETLQARIIENHGGLGAAGGI